MKFVDQRYLHKPEINQHGDCWAACISTITEIPIEEIPDVNDPKYSEWPTYWYAMWNFLKDKGFLLYCENVNQFKGNGDCCIACGKSPRGNFNHAVIWNNGMIHDPHPDKTGILNIDHFEIIEKTTK